MTFLGWLSDPYKWLSDLQLGDEKVTLNHLGVVFSLGLPIIPAQVFGVFLGRVLEVQIVYKKKRLVSKTKPGGLTKILNNKYQ